MITKLNTVATAAIVAALAIPSVAAPAFARNSHDAAPTWDACFTLAVERGSGPGKGGGENNKGGAMGQYVRFMDECLAGKIPFGADPNAVNSSARARAK